MKIAVVAANGKAGQDIVAEAVNRDLDVTAIVRGQNKSKAEKVIIKDIFDLEKEDLQDFDIVIDAFGVFDPERLSEHSTTLKHLADLVADTDTRLLVVGGAGSLYVDADMKTQLMDTPDFPDMFKPLASAMGVALGELRKRNDVNWTYISPAADFDAEGTRTGHYELAGETLTTNGKGDSYISYADYAIAMVDEAVKGNHKQERISVYSA